MENVQQLMGIDSDIFDDPQNYFLMDLESVEQDIIVKIFNELRLRDRLNLVSTCQKLFHFHNSLPKFCDNIWFNAGKAALRDFELARDYRNIKLKFDSSQSSVKKVLAPFVPAMKALRLQYQETNVDDQQNPNHVNTLIPIIVETLPLLSELTSLDLTSYNPHDHFESELLTVNFDASSITTSAVVMKHLRELKMNFNLYAALQGTFIDFSQCKQLESINILPRSGFGLSLEDELNAIYPLAELIQQQKELKSLQLGFDWCTRIFDSPLILESQKLHEFEIEEKDEGADFEQQENLLDFLESQANLQMPQIRICDNDDHGISPRMSQFIGKSLDWPSDHLFLNCNEDSFIFLNKPCKLTTNELRRIFRAPIQKNEVTVHVSITFGNKTRHYRNMDWLITGVCNKNPNMKSLFVGSIHRCGYLTNLSSLNNLAHLKDLAIILSPRIGSCLRDVNISGLEKFTLSMNDRLMKHRDFVQLEKFLSRHSKLTKVTIDMVEDIDDLNEHALRTHVNDCISLLHYIIENMKDVKAMEFSGNAMKSHKDHEAATLRLIEEHARIGFRLQVDDKLASTTFEKTAKCVKKFSCPH